VAGHPSAKAHASVAPKHRAAGVHAASAPGGKEIEFDFIDK